MDTNTTGAATLERQWACIRTLRDEAGRYSDSERRAVAIREQLREEETRLAQLLAETRPA